MLDTNTFAQIYARLTHEMRLQLRRKKTARKTIATQHSCIYLARR